MQGGDGSLPDLRLADLEEDTARLQRLIAEYEYATHELRALSDGTVNQLQALNQENAALERQLQQTSELGGWAPEPPPEHDVIAEAEAGLQQSRVLQHVLSLLQRDAELLPGDDRAVAHTVTEGGGRGFSTPPSLHQQPSFDSAAHSLHRLLRVMEADSVRIYQTFPDQSLEALRAFFRRQSERLTSSRRLLETMMETRASEGASSSAVGAPCPSGTASAASAAWPHHTEVPPHPPPCGADGARLALTAAQVTEMALTTSQTQSSQPPPPTTPRPLRPGGTGYRPKSKPQALRPQGRGRSPPYSKPAPPSLPPRPMQ